MRDLHFGEKVLRQRANCGLPLEARETLLLLDRLATARAQREKAYAALRWIAENDPDDGRTVTGRQGVFGARARDVIDCTAYDPEIIYEPGSHNGAARAAHAAVTEAVDPVTDCNCASRGLAEEHRHGSMCPYGVARRSEASGFDPDELVRWAETYGHPETWAKKAQELHAKLDALGVEHARLRMQLSEWD